MLLPFKKYIQGQPTHFKEKILACFFKNGYNAKIHTIRKSKRIKPGTILHMAYGVRTKFYEQFNIDIPELEKCVSTQEIIIKWFYPFEDWSDTLIYIDGRIITNDVVQELAKNDGFNNAKDFFDYFIENFEGQIIHWTDFKY